MTDWQMCRVLGSKFDKDDFPCIQVQRLGGGTNTVQLHHTAGFVHRPLDPSADGTACQAMVGDDGGSLVYAHLGYEPRAQTFLPAIAPGDSLVYSGSGAFFRANKDGRLSLFTTDDNTTNGRTISLSLSPTNPTPGMPDGLEYNHPHCRWTFNGTGFHATHSSGARIDFGSVVMPDPFSALSSYATLSAGVVHIEGSVVQLGTALGVAEPVTKSSSLIATVHAPTALALEAINAALVAIGETPPITANGASQSAIEAATTAIQAAVAALSPASLVAIGSASTLTT